MVSLSPILYIPCHHSYSCLIVTFCDRHCPVPVCDATAPTPEGWYLTADMTCIWFPGQLLRGETGAPWHVWPFGPALTDHSSDAWKPLN